MAAVAAAIACLACACAGSSSSSEVTFDPGSTPAVVPLTTVSVAGLSGKAGNFDALEMDQGGHRLYAADRSDSTIDVVDTSDRVGRYARTVVIGQPPNGLVFAPDLGRLFVGVEDGSVAVVDEKTGSPTRDTVVARVSTGSTAVDLVDYDPKDRLVVAAAGSSLVVVDAVSPSVRGTVQLGTPLEQPRYDPADGHVYVSAPKINSVIAVDARTLQELNRWTLGVVCAPAGLAIDPATQIAMFACGETGDQHAVAWDLRTQAVERVFPQAGQADLAVYDAKADRFLVAAAEAQVSVAAGPEVAAFSGSPLAYVGRTRTHHGSHSVAYDETNQVVYVPLQEAGRALASLPLPGS